MKEVLNHFSLSLYVLPFMHGSSRHSGRSMLNIFNYDSTFFVLLRPHQFGVHEMGGGGGGHYAKGDKSRTSTSSGIGQFIVYGI